MNDYEKIIGVAEEIGDQYSLKELKKSSAQITNLYKNDSGKGKKLVSDKMDVYTYLLVRFPATYMAISRVLEICSSIFDDEIQSILDVGAGMGTATIAISRYLKKDAKFTLLEREDSMIELGNKLFEMTDENFNYRYEKCDYSTYSFDNKYDLVIASYTLNELNEQDRINVVNKLWNATNKYLIIIEPGTKEGYNQIIKEREFILSAGGKIIAPCGTNNKCPLPNDDWCHFVVRVPRSKIHKTIKEAEVPFEDEKFSFVAFSKEREFELKNRILRHPIIRPGNVSIKYCSQDGIKEKVLSKKDGEYYKTAKKLKTGDYLE